MRASEKRKRGITAPKRKRKKQMKQANKKNLPPAHYKKEKINRENLCTAIRCFFEIDRKAKPQVGNITVNLYLHFIYKAVWFKYEHCQEPYFEIFKQWIEQYNSDEKQIIYKQAPNTLLPHRIQAIKAHFINLLTSEICDCFKTGFYELQPFTPTKAEKRKEYAERCKKYGIAPPKRKSKKTTAQAAKEFKAYSNQLNEQIN